MCSPRAPVLILTVVATVDDLANIFALIKTVEKLEKAYVCSAIPSQSYENACVELISKYKTLKYTIADIVPDFQHFMQGFSFIFSTLSVSFLRVCLTLMLPFIPGLRRSFCKNLRSEYYLIESFVFPMDGFSLGPSIRQPILSVFPRRDIAF